MLPNVNASAFESLEIVRRQLCPLAEVFHCTEKPKIAEAIDVLGDHAPLFQHTLGVDVIDLRFIALVTHIERTATKRFHIYEIKKQVSQPCIVKVYPLDVRRESAVSEICSYFSYWKGG